MTTPIIICDDSSFARKQVARSLPKGWDVKITFARNGKEGIEAIEDGKGDIIFLDLTMPVIDGFGVLQYIKSHDLPTLAIVISGDVQDESHKRVMQYGAIAFIKKPVDMEVLSSILDQYGLSDVLTGARVEVDTNVDFYDWCQEISNVAMGRAAHLLSKAISENITISVPRVSLLEPSELSMALSSSTEDSGFHVAIQGFIGSGISGETLLIYNRNDMHEVARLTKYDGKLDKAATYELLTDISNVLVGASLKGLSDQLDVKFSQGHPMIYAARNSSGGIIRDAQLSNKKILTIEFNYDIGVSKIHCNQLMLFTEGGFKVLNRYFECTQALT